VDHDYHQFVLSVPETGDRGRARWIAEGALVEGNAAGRQERPNAVGALLPIDVVVIVPHEIECHELRTLVRRMPSQEGVEHLLPSRCV
jgi:hypothetical protein